MEDLTQTISNLVGILLGIVGAVGVGFFIYGAYLYLTASGAPHQMERGKSAMMDRPGGHRAGDGGLRRRRAGDERGRGIAGGPLRARPDRPDSRADQDQLGDVRKEREP